MFEVNNVFITNLGSTISTVNFEHLNADWDMLFLKLWLEKLEKFFFNSMFFV